MGTRDYSNNQGASTAFVGECPLIEVCMGGVKMTGLLDTGSQVTLVQQQVMDLHFPEVNKTDTPLLFALKAANGLEIPYSGYAVKKFRVEV